MTETKFNSTSIENMSRFQRWARTMAMSYHWHEFIAVMWPLLLSAWGAGLLLIWLIESMPGTSSSDTAFLVYILFLAPLISLVIFRRRVIADGRSRFEQFLNDNKLLPNKLDGFGIELSGMPDARFQRIVKAVGGSGESYYSAITVSLKTTVPEIVLDAKRNNRWISSLPNYYKQNQRLHLEGDFDSYFDLYTPTKWRIETLSIITPDVMQALITSGYKFDLEITGGGNAQLIISTPGYVGYEPIKLQALYDAFMAIFPEIKHQLGTINFFAGQTHSLHLEKQQAHSYAIFDRQVRLYRSMAYIWSTVGVILGTLYLFGVRDYVVDIGFVYIGISMVYIYGYLKFK